MNGDDTQDLVAREKAAYKAAGSYQQEIQEDIMGEKMDTLSPPEPLREGSIAEKDSPDTVGTNPKRTENSRED